MNSDTRSASNDVGLFLWTMERVIRMKRQDYHCTKCYWRIRQTRKAIDGISCPKCKGLTVMPGTLKER
jgi:DNA-directed RNA polymerase subunit RPC12/RpoP